MERIHQAWPSDSNYVPTAHGSLYVVAILDMVSRRTLTWQRSNTLFNEFVVAAVKEGDRPHWVAGHLQRD